MIANNTENKARFLAQHLGLQITYPNTDGKLMTCRLSGVSFTEIETTYKRKKKGCVGDYLAFKSNGNHNSNALNAYLELKYVDTEYLITKGDSLNTLRSEGYAVPWMDLSVEDLIEYGWIKFKKSE